MAGVRCGVAATARCKPASKAHFLVRMRAVRRRALPALLGRHHRPRFTDLFPATASVGPPSGPISGSWHICQSALRWPTAGRLFLERASRGVCLRRYCSGWPNSPREPVRFEIIFPVTFQSPYGFRHTRYASVSISARPVLECDRAGRRSVNIGLPPSMNGCEKPFIHGLNRRFTVLNS